MPIEENNKINYVVSCVTEFAYRYELPQSKAFQFLYNYKGIEFLKENYEIEHTLSFEEVIDDLFMICKNNGGTI